MNQDDAGMSLLLMGEPACCFNEVGDVEGNEYPSLSSRIAKQFDIFECFQRRIARSRHCVMLQLDQSGGNRRRDVGVKQDSAEHSAAYRLQPRQRSLQILRAPSIQFKEVLDLIWIGPGICLPYTDRDRR